MEIPEGAYTAAGEAAGKVGLLKASPEVSHIIVEAIHAAAPFIAAQALRDVADGYARTYYDADITFGEVAEDLMASADEMDPQ